MADTTQTAGALELSYERTFAAPRASVFAAWTDPEILARWWGPKTHTIPEVSLDPKVGGAWMTLMRSPEGTEHRVSGVYREISPPTRLVFTWAWGFDGQRGHETVVTVEFDEVPEGTLMRFHQAAFESPDMTVAHDQGWTSTFEKFADFAAAGGLG